MELHMALGITIGMVAKIWTQFSFHFTLFTWVAFIAAACFYAAGAGRRGFLKILPSNLSGLIWGWPIVWCVGAVGASTGALAIVVTIGAFMMRIQAKWSVRSFIPGAFAGTAVFFATGGEWIRSSIAFIASRVLAWISSWTAGLLVEATSRPAVPVAVTAI